MKVDAADYASNEPQFCVSYTYDDRHKQYVAWHIADCYFLIRSACGHYSFIRFDQNKPAVSIRYAPFGTTVDLHDHSWVGDHCGDAFIFKDTLAKEIAFLSFSKELFGA